MKALLAALGLAVASAVIGCGESYPIELKVEVSGEDGLTKALVAVYIDTETDMTEQSLPYEVDATIDNEDQTLYAKAKMVDGTPGQRLTVKILRGEDEVANEAVEDTSQVVEATWSPH